MASVSLNSNVSAPARAGRRDALWLVAACALVTAVLLAFAETLAFTGDEGFHLMAAESIASGMRPYLDFCFPQTPLEAYWFAALIRCFGPSWRVIHAASALTAAAGVALMVDFVYRRFPERPWRLGAALAAAAFIGLSSVMVEFGTVGQAYGLLVLTTVAAFRLAIAAVDRRGSLPAAAAGLLAGAGAAASLLSAPVGPVLLLWIFLQNRAGGRWRKAGGFVGGYALPFLPVLWLFAQSPWVVWFNLTGYHLYFRTLYWNHPLPHDIDVLTSWAADPLALFIGLLAIGAVFFLGNRSGWEHTRRSEFYLCGWLAAALSLELVFGHPTFTRYFVVVAPFAGALAVPGLYAVGSRVFAPDRPFWPVLVSVAIAVSVFGRTIPERHDVLTWPQNEDIARKLLQVTPPGQQAFTDGVTYFLMRRQPLPGMEFDYSHKISLPAARLAALHILPEAKLKQMVLDGRFASALSCDEEDKTYGFDKVFTQKAEVHDCLVYWAPRAVK